MPCPRCGAETRPGQKFCAECGLALSSTCPNCGAHYEGSPKVCAECGFNVGSQTAAGPAATAQVGAGQAQLPAAERRYVSVLFADLVGFTQLSEQQDPEEVRDLLSRYFDVARQVIDGYGGTVEKFIGDAVMAVWGAPVAREDDPERAVRAAIELVDRVRGLSIVEQHLALRAGVLSGEAAVTPGRVGEGMVAGDLVNTASRLQSVAPPGVVLVGESTYRATSAAIAYEPAGDQLLKGKQLPVAAWRALRVVARIGGEGREEGLEPPFVGRDEELRLLKEQVHAAERERKMRMVAISGQAGIGKSRLIWELEKYLDGLAGPQLYYWHQGRSPSYGEGIAFWALGEMVRGRARIAEGEDEASTRGKLRATLDEFVPDPQERRWLEPALGALLGIDEADWAAREQLFSAWRTFFERIADKGPTVLVFEDLQWADTGLLDFVEHLVEWSRDRPMLVVTLARPELLERRPNFGMGYRALVALHLEPLPNEAMRVLLHGLVSDIGEADLARIVERSAGVPLYAVETVRSLVDGGHLVRHGDVYELVGELPTLDVPPTLRALIAARLDALEASDRALLQDAAVLGLAFGVPALAALTGGAEQHVESQLRQLSHKELVALETDPRSPERGQYRFRQGMIREISYATLSRRERRGRHLAAARYYETMDEDELAGVRATHYLEAFRAAPEGEEGATVAAQARVALRAAADRASRLHSPAQALHYYKQAIAVTFDEADLSELHSRAAFSAYRVGDLDAGLEHVQAAIDWYRANGDLDRAGELTAFVAGWLFEASRLEEGMSMLGTALAGLPADAARASIQLNGERARGHLFRGEGEEALTAISAALETAERMNMIEPTLQLIITKSWALGQVGRFREALTLLTGAMHIADAEDELFARIRTRFNLSSVLTAHDPHRALRTAREGIAIAKQYGIALSAANNAGNAAHAALLIGDLDEVLRLEESAGDVATSLSNFVHGHAATALALRGDMDAARQRMAVVAEMVVGSTSPQDVAAHLYQRAMIAFADGDLIATRSLALEARDAYAGGNQPISAVIAGHMAALLGDLASLRSDLEWMGSPSGAAWLERSRQTLLAAQSALDDRVHEALQAYRRLIDEWRAADLRFDLALTLLERARLLGEVDTEAAAGRAEATEIFAAMGAEGLLERIEAAAPVAAPAKGSRPVQSREGDTAKV